MKITSFNPLIVTKDAAAARALFEAMGFEKRHELPFSTKGKEMTCIRMKNEEGFYVDIAQADNIPQDLTLIRMNVSDFDEAYDFLISKGFKNSQGDQTVDTKTNKSAMMISPSGFAFDLCQHIKE